MNDIYAGKFCGVCHNGERAFDAQSNCTRCHVKQ
jgi:c(7)-type cytochrome triheme protein